MIIASEAALAAIRDWKVMTGSMGPIEFQP
jgi:hypothetical protein